MPDLIGYHSLNFNMTMEEVDFEKACAIQGVLALLSKSDEQPGDFAVSVLGM